MLNYICVNHNMKLLITYSHMKAWYVGIAAIKMFYTCIAHSLQHGWTGLLKNESHNAYSDWYFSCDIKMKRNK